MQFLDLFFRFILYSILGYFMEILYCSIMNKKITLNRGFFLGPYLPIYGICCIVMSFILNRYSNDIFALFTMSFLICSIIEYITSYLLEKIFKVRWWDYRKMKFNLNGRVCLLNSILFGVGGVGLITLINPIVNGIIFYMPNMLESIISFTLLIVFITDLSITIKTLVDIKISSLKYTDHDATEEIKEKIRLKLEKHSFFVSKVLNAFPKLSGINSSIVADFRNRVNEFRKERRR